MDSSSEVELPAELEELEDAVTCWVCFGLFAAPTTLHCAHTFCRACITDVARSQAHSDDDNTSSSKKNGGAPCPFCRREFSLPLPGESAEMKSRVDAFRAKVDAFRSSQTGGGEAQQDPAPAGGEGEGSTRVEQDSPALWLPPDILRELLLFLPAREAARAGLVCRDWAETTSSPLMWRSICLNEFPFCSVERYGKNWKAAYAARSNIVKGWDGGKAGDFSMTPLRGHKAFVEDAILFHGRIVSGSADSTVKVWKCGNKSPLHTFTDHEGPVHCVAFTDRIAAGSADGSARIWDGISGSQTACFRHTRISTTTVPAGADAVGEGVTSIQQLASGALATGGSDAAVKLWDVRAGNTSPTHTFSHRPGGGSGKMSIEQLLVLGDVAPADAEGAASSSNNNASSASAAIVARDSSGVTKVWDVRNTASAVHDLSGGGTVPAASAFAPAAGGTGVMVGCRDGQIFACDTATGASAALSGARHFSRITSLFCDGTQACSSAEDGSLKVWDVRPARRRLQHTLDGHKDGPAHAVRFTSVAGSGSDPAANAGKVVSCGADNTIRVWNLARGTQMYALLGGSVARRRANADANDHPTMKGCSQVFFDDSRVVGVFGAILREYDFEVFKP